MKPSEGIQGGDPAGTSSSGPGDRGRPAVLQTARVQPSGDGRGARLTVGLLALAAVVLVGAAVLAGPGTLGLDGTGDGGVGGAPAAGDLGSAGSPGRAPEGSAQGWVPGGSPGPAAAASTPAPSVTPYLVWPTPTPAPERTPPPDVAVVDRGPAALAPSGVTVVGAGAPREWANLLADADGILWAAGSGGLLRLDPASGDRSVWTVEDDAAFGKLGSLFADAGGGGGVWLSEPMSGTIRRFDGTRFVAVLEAPAPVNALAETDDGTLWVGTTAGLFRRVGEAWEGMAFASEQTTVSSLLVDPRGDVWVGWLQYPTPPGVGWVTRWDGAGWDRFDSVDAAPLGSPVQALRAAPDGSIWVGTAGGLARWDGSGWTTEDQPLGSVSSVAWGPDATQWIAAGDEMDGAVRVARRAPDGWVVYGPDEGLPGANESGWIAASIAPTDRGVFVGTGAGIHRLEGERWVDLDPAPAVGAEVPGWVSALVAVSRREAWAANDRGIWHAVDGTWTRTPDPAGRSLADDNPGDLLLDRDGRLWAATRAGVLVHDADGWSAVDDMPATALALGPDGRVWAAGEQAPMDGINVRSFSHAGSGWEATRLPVTDLITWPRGLAAEADGTVWVGTPGNWGIRPGLVRYAPGRGWERVAVRGATTDVAIHDIVVGPDGTTWAVGSDVVPEGTATSDEPWVPPPWWIVRLTDGPGPAIDGEGGWAPWSIVVLPDGSPAAAAVGHGLAAWDGSRWTHRLDGLVFDKVSTAADGAVWTAANSGTWVLP